MYLKIELKGLDEALAVLDPQIIQKAAQRTIQRAAQSGKTVISSQIREKFNIKKSDLDAKIAVDLSGIRQLRARLTVYGSPLSMTRFNPTQTQGDIKTFVSKNFGLAQSKLKRAARSSGVRVSIIKGKQANLRAFIAPGKSGGGLQVWRRVGKARLPIRPLKVIGYASIIRKPENIKAVERKIMEQLDKEWKTNLAFYSKGKIKT